jgi:hypothetical protein
MNTTRIPLKDWAAKNKIPLRTAHDWAEKGKIPVKKEASKRGLRHGYILTIAEDEKPLSMTRENPFADLALSDIDSDIEYYGSLYGVWRNEHAKKGSYRHFSVHYESLGGQFKREYKRRGE